MSWDSVSLERLDWGGVNKMRKTLMRHILKCLFPPGKAHKVLKRALNGVVKSFAVRLLFSGGLCLECILLEQNTLYLITLLIAHIVVSGVQNIEKGAVPASNSMHCVRSSYSM